MIVPEGAPTVATPDRGLSRQGLLRAGLATATLGLALLVGGGETASAAPGETSVTPRCEGEEVVLDTSFYNDPNTYGVTLDSVGAQYLEFSTGTSVAEDLPSGETAEVAYNTGLSSVEGGQVNFSIIALGGDFTDTAQASYGALDCEQTTTTTTEQATTTTEATTTTTEATTTTTEQATTTTTEQQTTTTTEASTTTTSEPGSTTTTEQQSTTSTTALPGSTTTLPGNTTTQPETPTTAAPAVPAQPQTSAGGEAPAATAVSGNANFTG